MKTQELMDQALKVMTVYVCKDLEGQEDQRPC